MAYWSDASDLDSDVYDAEVLAQYNLEVAQDKLRESFANHDIQLLLANYFRTRNKKEAIEIVTNEYLEVIKNATGFTPELSRLILCDYAAFEADLDSFCDRMSPIFSNEWKSFDHGSIIDVKISGGRNACSLFFEDGVNIGVFLPDKDNSSVDDWSDSGSYNDEPDVNKLFGLRQGELKGYLDKTKSKITDLLVIKSGILTRHANGKFGMMVVIGDEIGSVP